MQSDVFICFRSSGLPIRKSVYAYFNKVVAIVFLVSSPTKFEISASGNLSALVADTTYASRLSACKLKIELYLSPTTQLQLSKVLVLNKEHLQQPTRQTNIVHLSRRHIPLALSSNLVSDEN